MRRPPTLLSAIVILCVLGGCSSNPVQQSALTQDRALSEQQRSAITDRGELSVHSRLVYRIVDLEEQLEEDLPKAVAALDADDRGLVTPLQKGMAVAETCYLLADQEPDVQESRRGFTRAVLVALQTIRSSYDEFSLFDPRMRLVAELYSRSLARIISVSQEGVETAEEWIRSLEEGPIPIAVDRAAGVDPLLFNRLIPVDSVQLEGIPNEHRRHGVGVPLIGVRENTRDGERVDPRRAPTMVEPITVLALPDADGGLTLSFYDAFQTTSAIGASGDPLPLAADFTAPLAWLVANSPAYTRENPSLFDPESFEPFTGLYFAEPYNPNKIPVVFVHGLWSSPLTWIWLLNEVWGDPVLRERYQCWYYAYPTGLPILGNAGKFRRMLEEVRQEVDPEGDDAASQGMVLVGHSMGGLLSKHMVKHVGNSLYDARCAIPFDQVKASEEHLELMRRSFFHVPLPYVERVIFMCTPHRGSGLAEGLVGAIGDALITLPAHLVTAVETILADNPGILRNQELLGEGPMSSIKSLRSDSPLLKALDDAPWREGLPFHSIIGDEEQAGRKGGGDGVVPYRSSTLPGARSEAIFKSDHSITGKPAAMAEVRRILRLNLQERGQ